MTLNQEKTLANLQISGDLNAAQLDALLRKLALLRSDMTPEVLATRDDLVHADTAMLVEEKPALVIRARQGGGFRMWLRHRGFGWVGYQIDKLAADTMADYIVSFRVAGETRPNFIRDDLGKTH